MPRKPSFLARLTVIAALGLAAAGCSGSDGSDGSDSSAPTPDPTSASTPVATGPPVTLRSSPGFSYCLNGKGPYVVAVGLKAHQPVTLSEVELTDATNVSLDAAEVSEVPAGTPMDGLTLSGTALGGRVAKDYGWQGRQPLDGAQLDPGRYFVFLPLDVSGLNAHFSGLEMPWASADRSGTSQAELVTDFQKSC